jgi:hypothetical protein
VRNLGACYYYMRRYEPALSNLRDYVHRKKDMASDDRAEVEGWIGEMERLRGQSPAVATAPLPAVLPVAAPETAGSLPTAPGAPAAAAPFFAPAGSSAGAPSPTPTASPSTQPAENAFPQPGAFNGQPGYPQTQYSAQPAYAQGQVGAQPTYPETQYSPVGGGYPPANQPDTYPPHGSAAGTVAAPAGQQPSTGGGRTAAAWILGIAGLGSAGAGVYFAVKAKDDFSKVETKYNPSLEKEGKNASIAAWVLCGAGAAALATGLIVGVSGSSNSSSMALAPVVGPRIAGATLGGTF